MSVICSVVRLNPTLATFLATSAYSLLFIVLPSRSCWKSEDVRINANILCPPPTTARLSSRSVSLPSSTLMLSWLASDPDQPGDVRSCHSSPKTPYDRPSDGLRLANYSNEALWTDQHKQWTNSLTHIFTGEHRPCSRFMMGPVCVRACVLGGGVLLDKSLQWPSKVAHLTRPPTEQLSESL